MDVMNAFSIWRLHAYCNAHMKACLVFLAKILPILRKPCRFFMFAQK